MKKRNLYIKKKPEKPVRKKINEPILDSYCKVSLEAINEIAKKHNINPSSFMLELKDFDENYYQYENPDIKLFFERDQTEEEYGLEIKKWEKDLEEWKKWYKENKKEIDEIEKEKKEKELISLTKREKDIKKQLKEIESLKKKIGKETINES